MADVQNIIEDDLFLINEPADKGTKQILWSGGLDSTYMIHKFLEEGYKVESHYVEIVPNKHKTIRELKAIEKLLPHFESYSNFNYKGSTKVEIPATFIAEYAQSWRSGTGIKTEQTNLVEKPQIPVFLFAATYLPSPVCLGYLENENPYIPKIIDAAKMLSEFRNFERPLIVEFPILKTPKIEIYKKLPMKILQHVTFCQHPRMDLCGECAPCQKMKELVPESIFFKD